MDLIVQAFIQQGMVVGSHGTSGGPASSITYDFMFWTIGTGDITRVNNVLPDREQPDDMEVTRLALNGCLAFRTVVNGDSTVVLWPGQRKGERYGEEECP